MAKRICILTVAMGIAATTSAAAGPVTGVVRTVARAGVTAASVIVYAEPIGAPAPSLPRRFVLMQKNKTFQPRLLAVPVGSTIDFPNGDRIYHNVFSLSGPQPFDLGLYRAGESRRRVFTAAGIYRVFCNIHPQMTAMIAVVPTGFTALVSPDGRFTLDLPPGRYRVTAMSERAPPASIELSSTQGSSTAPELTLDETSWALARHKNKFGKDYPADAYPR